MAEIYKSLGASASKSGLHSVLKRTANVHSGEYFASIVPDIAGRPDYYSFLHCDGAGTKAIVAYLLYRELGNARWFASLAQDALVMNLDDIYCLGKPESLLLSNTIARNSNLIKDDALEAIISRYKTLTEELKNLGIPLSLAGGETADCGDIVRTLVVDAVISGSIAKRDSIRASRITVGDVIIGISSTGQASYESTANSGIASNGLTLARHALIKNDYLKKYPEILDPNINSNLAYRGPFSLSEIVPELSMSIGEALLSPTRTYAPVLAKIYDHLGEEIHGVIHNTGGGLTKVLRFGSGNAYIKDAVFPCPAIFALIQKHAAVPWREMYEVFNMGQRIEVYLPASSAPRVVDIAKQFNLEAKEIGHVDKSPATDGSNLVRVSAPGIGTFEYKLADK